VANKGGRAYRFTTVRGVRLGWFAGALLLSALACNLLTGVSSLDEATCAVDCGAQRDGSVDGPRVDARTSDARTRDSPSAADAEDALRDVLGMDAVDAGDGGPPPPPITFVQTKGGKETATSATVAFATDVQKGDTLIVAIDFGTASGATVTEVTDTLGDTYDVVLGPFEGAGVRQYIYYAISGATGPDAVTVTISASTEIEVYLHEYSGLAQVGTVDIGASDSTSGVSDADGGVVVGPIVTHSSNELLFVFATCTNACVAGPGFLTRSTFDGNLTEDRIAVAPASYTGVATAIDGGWAASMSAFHGL
jgi:hypothetical protein